MSLRDICSGDLVRVVTMGGGTFGNPPTASEGSPIECRIDLSGGNESNETGVPNLTRNGLAYFSEDPKVKVGQYLRWISRAKKKFSPEIMLRIVDIDDAEGRPGEKPWLWTVTFTEDKQRSEMIRS